MFGKNKASNESTREKKKTFKDLAETQQGETEVWIAAASMPVNCYAFSNDFAKFEGKTRTIKIRCNFILNAVVYDNFAHLQRYEFVHIRERVNLSRLLSQIEQVKLVIV